MQNKAFKFRFSELTQTTGTGFALMILTFVIMFIVEVFHYRESLQIFTGYAWASLILAFLMSAAIQLARIFFGIMGIEDFANGHKWAAIFGLTISVALAVVETVSVVFIARSVSSNSEVIMASQIIKFGLLSMVWIGFATEIRLCFAYAAKMGKSKRSSTGAKSNGKLNGNTQKSLADFAVNG